MPKILDWLKKNIKLVVYTACGFGLSWIDLWRGIGHGAQWALAVNCIGFCIFPMIVLRLDWRMLLPRAEVAEKWQKAFRIVFFLWIIVFAVCAYPAFKHFAPGTDYDAQIVTAVANVGLYGAVVIRMYFCLFYERKTSDDKSTAFKSSVFIIWLAFMVLAIISVSKLIWPLWFLVMFGSLYLAPLKKKELEEIILGIANGMIIGFFLIQSRAFLYRPYDGDFRYYGHYTNPNVNAMFYLYAYVAWLVKLTYYRIIKAPKRYAFAFILASSMWVFEFLTGCRTAWLALAMVTVLYWFVETIAVSGKLKAYISKFALMALMALITFLPVFACARYIPPLRHHPIWFQGEYSEDKVMSWDPIDSPKFVSLDEVLQGNLGRLAFFTKNRSDDESVTEDREPEEVCEHSVIYTGDGETVLSYSCGNIPGSDKLHPLYGDIDYERILPARILGIRYHIYRYILGNIKLFGNEEPYFSVWLTEDFQLVHAHNSILMITYWFGPFAGILFALILLFSFISAVRKICQKRFGDETALAAWLSLLALTAFIVSGPTECNVFPGEMSLSLFFIALFPLIRTDLKTVK